LYVANQALWAIWTLAAQECYLQRVASSGAIELIITAMRKHPHEAGVQVQALWCVYWLTVKHITSRSKVVSLGGSDLVSMAAWNHRKIKSITDVVPTIQICLTKDAAAEIRGLHIEKRNTHNQIEFSLRTPGTASSVTL
jgi:hypothetical protein